MARLSAIILGQPYWRAGFYSYSGHLNVRGKAYKLAGCEIVNISGSCHLRRVTNRVHFRAYSMFSDTYVAIEFSSVKL